MLGVTQYLFFKYFGLVKTYKKQKRYQLHSLNSKRSWKVKWGNPELKGKIEISILPFFLFLKTTTIYKEMIIFKKVTKEKSKLANLWKQIQML